MPRMSWPSWRRTRTVTRAADEVKLMVTGAGGSRHCWSRGAVSRHREAWAGQPGAEQQGRQGARRRASSERDSRGAARRGTAGAWVLRAGAPGRREQRAAFKLNHDEQNWTPAEVLDDGTARRTPARRGDRSCRSCARVAARPRHAAGASRAGTGREDTAGGGALARPTPVPVAGDAAASGAGACFFFVGVGRGRREDGRRGRWGRRRREGERQRAWVEAPAGLGGGGTRGSERRRARPLHLAARRAGRLARGARARRVRAGRGRWAQASGSSRSGGSGSPGGARRWERRAGGWRQEGEVPSVGGRRLGGRRVEKNKLI
jgi:hypothetical protein